MQISPPEKKDSLAHPHFSTVSVGQTYEFRNRSDFYVCFPVSLTVDIFAALRFEQEKARLSFYFRFLTRRGGSALLNLVLPSLFQALGQ